MLVALGIQLPDRVVNGCIQVVGSGEGAVREGMTLQVAPAALDGVEFGRVLWQPLHRKPMRPPGQGGPAHLAGVDGAGTRRAAPRLAQT